MRQRKIIYVPNDTQYRIQPIHKIFDKVMKVSLQKKYI